MADPGTGRHSRAREEPLASLDSLDLHWDPTEELAHLLYQTGAPKDLGPLLARTDDDAVTGGGQAPQDPLAGLSQITAELPRLRPPPPHRRSRSRARPRARAIGVVRATSLTLAAVAAVVVLTVCVFGGLVSYGPLRDLALHRTAAPTVGWWPLLIYGPWVVASLSVLRAGLHRRRAAHSWTVVLLFSTVAMLLCISQAPRTPLDAATAALPALAVLACFQQLIRQITLTRPPRQAHPRHRTRPASSPRTSGPKKPA